MVPDNAGYAPNTFATTDRRSSKFYDLSAAFHTIAPWMMQKASPSASSNVLCRYRFASFERRSPECLVKIIDQVVNAFQAHRETDEIRRRARLLLLLRRQLGVCGAGRVDDEGLGIAHVGQVREEFDVPDQLYARFQSALDAEANNGPIAVQVVPSRCFVLWMTREARIAHPIDGGVAFQELGDALRILAVPLHAQGQRLQSLQEEESVERRDRRADIAQQLHARLDDIGQWAQCLHKAQAMIRWVGLDQPWKLPVGPVECAAGHDHAAYGGAMPTDELGRRMHHDIGAMLERLHQVGRRQRVVENER